MAYYPSFANLNKFKVSLLQEEATEIESFVFVGSTKRWYLRYLSIHRCRSLNANPNIYSCESIFLSKGNTKIWLNY